MQGSELGRTKLSTLESELRRNLENGEYDGYIIFATNKLIPRLPKGYPIDRDAFKQEFYYYALEAIRDYKPEYVDGKLKTQFTTYLVKHFKVRSYQWFNWAWLPMNHPVDQRVYHWSECEEKTASGQFDPTRVRQSVSQHLQLEELLADLSERSKEILTLLLGLISDDLIEAFTEKDCVRRVSRMSGFEQWEIEMFLEEMRRDLPMFIDGISKGVA